jgi:hypothetical protein
MHVSDVYSSSTTGFNPSYAKCPGSGTEIIPGTGKHSDTDTRIKPLPLTNGHGRYITT